LAIADWDCGLRIGWELLRKRQSAISIDNLNRQFQSAISIGTPQSQFEIRNPKIRNQQSPIRN